MTRATEKMLLFGGRHDDTTTLLEASTRNDGEAGDEDVADSRFLPVPGTPCLFLSSLFFVFLSAGDGIFGRQISGVIGEWSCRGF